jgi:hypothetical protein
VSFFLHFCANSSLHSYLGTQLMYRRL